MPYLKIAAIADNLITIEGYGVPFGGPIKGRDMHGQFFSKNTDFALDLIPDGQRPLLYQHGLDKKLDTQVIGRWGVKRIDDGGVWVQAQLNARSEYINEIKELIDQDALGFSSGTMGHLVKVSSKTGEILKWALVELSLTPNPANPNAYIVKQKKSAKAYIKSLMEGEEAPAEAPTLQSAIDALLTGTITQDQARIITDAVVAGLPKEEEASPADATEDVAEEETAKNFRNHIAAGRSIINAVKCGEAPIAMMFDALADILESLDKTMHDANGEPKEMEGGYAEGHDDEAADRTLIAQVVNERAAMGKSLKHGDHDQSEHGNWASGGSGRAAQGDSTLRETAYFRMDQVASASAASGVHPIDVQNMRGYASQAKEAHAGGNTTQLHDLVQATGMNIVEHGNTNEPKAAEQRKFAWREIEKQITALGKDLDPKFHAGADYRGFTVVTPKPVDGKIFRILRA